MASASTRIESMRRSGPACDVLPVPPGRQLPSGPHELGNGMRELAHSCSELATAALEFARISAIRTVSQVGHGIARSYCRTTHTTRDAITRTRDQARIIQREYPLRALGVLAGTAILAGAAIRIWRSRGR